MPSDDSVLIRGLVSLRRPDTSDFVRRLIREQLEEVQPHPDFGVYPHRTRKTTRPPRKKGE